MRQKGNEEMTYTGTHVRSDEKAAALQSSVCLLVQQKGEVQWLLNKEAGLLTLRESLQGVKCVGGDGGGSGGESKMAILHTPSAF